MNERGKEGGGWAVAYRVKATQEGQFHDETHDVDERSARKVFGRCIRAAELGLKVEGVAIDAVRLLKRTTITESWMTCQQHDVGVVAQWKRNAEWKGCEGVSVNGKRYGCRRDMPKEPMLDGMACAACKDAGRVRQTAPYHDETIPLGVPCLPGAWGGDGCAMHSGFDLDENGLCIEGRHAVKVLDFVVVPKAMQERWGLPATMTREEVEEVQACAVAELAHRGKDEGITDEQLARAAEVLERRNEVSR